MSLLFSNAYAQNAAAAAPGGLASFMPFVLIFIVMYFLMIRPQKKKLEQEQSMLKALKKGDEIYTKSGVLGKIAGMTDRVITLEIADNVKVKLLRSQVGGLASSVFEVNKNTK